MAEHKSLQVEQRTNRAITVEAGNGPGRWVESESQEALAALDARLNPDHGSAGAAISVVNEDALEHRSLIAFSEGSESAVATDEAATRLAAVNAFFEGADAAVPDLADDTSQAAWDEIQPTPF